MTRVLIVGANAPPEPVGIGKYTGGLAEWLDAHGHTVDLICTPPAYPTWRIGGGYRGWRYVRETRCGVRLWRCPLYVPRRPGGIGRLLHGLSFGLSGLPVALWCAATQRPAVVLCVVPTLCAAPAALLAARLSGAAAWLHVQDLEIDAAFSLGLLRGRRLRAMASALEGWLLRRFDRVTTISSAMQDGLRRKGVAPQRLGLMRNWVDTRAIRPQAGAAALRHEFGLPATGTVALYAGSFGCKHGLDALVEAARRLQDRPDIRVALVGAGPLDPWLRQRAARLVSLQVAGLVPAERLGALLACADLHLLPQAPPAADLGLPSKLAAMLASGRPTVAAAPPGSELSALVRGCGLVLPHNDGAAFAAAIRTLADTPVRRRRLGDAARTRATRHFDSTTILTEFERDLAAADGLQVRPSVRRRTALVLLAAVLALALAGPVAGQRLERGQTVLDRARPLYQPHGVRVGALVLKPAVEQRVAYVDNLQARADGGDADLVVRTAPELGLRTDWPRHAVSLRARAEQTGHREHAEENTLGGALDAAARFDLGAADGLRLKAGWARRFEPRSSPDDPGTRSPSAFDLHRASLEHRMRLGAVTATTRGGLRWIDHHDAELPDGTVVDNDDRDHVRMRAQNRLALPVLPRTDVFVQGTFDVRRYDAKVDDRGFARDSSGYEVVAGTAFDLTGLTFGEAYAGWRRQSYGDTELGDVEGLAAGLTLTSSVTELTTLRLGLSRQIKETTIAGAAGVLATETAFRVDHELLRNLLLHGQATYGLAEFEGLGRRDGTLGLRLGASYLMNRWLHWQVDLRHTRRHSEVASAEYARTAVTLTAKLQY